MCACELVCVCMYISVLAAKPPWAGKPGEEAGSWGPGERASGAGGPSYGGKPMFQWRLEGGGWDMGPHPTSIQLCLVYRHLQTCDLISFIQ